MYLNNLFILASQSIRDIFISLIVRGEVSFYLFIYSFAASSLHLFRLLQNCLGKVAGAKPSCMAAHRARLQFKNKNEGELNKEYYVN